MDVNQDDGLKALAAQAGVGVPDHPLVASFKRQAEACRALGIDVTRFDASQELLRGLWRLCGKIDGVEMKLQQVHVAGLPVRLDKTMTGATFVPFPSTIQLTPPPGKPE